MYPSYKVERDMATDMYVVMDKLDEEIICYCPKRSEAELIARLLTNRHRS